MSEVVESCPVCERVLDDGTRGDGSCERTIFGWDGTQLDSEAKCYSLGYDRLSLALSAERTARRVMREALEESVKLQSHYADLLNMFDSGKRRTFADADAWLARLAETAKERKP